MNASPGLPARSVRLARLKLLGIVAIFAGPLIAATFAYLGRDVLPVPHAASHGEITQPARPLEPFSFATPTGERLTLDKLRGRWTLVFITDACDAECEKILYHTRQVRVALGRDADRVQRLYVLTAAVEPASLSALLALHPGLMTAFASPEEAQAVLRLTEGHQKNAVYVVDPLGNLMLRYPPSFQPKGMLKDLKKLMRVSRVG